MQRDYPKADIKTLAVTTPTGSGKVVITSPAVVRAAAAGQRILVLAIAGRSSTR
jgi:hypothetical protein